MSCSVASRLTHPLVETSFGLRRRRVVATDRVVFISQFPCSCWARPKMFQIQSPGPGSHPLLEGARVGDKRVPVLVVERVPVLVMERVSVSELAPFTSQLMTV